MIIGAISFNEQITIPQKEDFVKGSGQSFFAKLSKINIAFVEPNLHNLCKNTQKKKPNIMVELRFRQRSLPF
jgi:hypothetical protein